jgi:predicted permease
MNPVVVEVLVSVGTSFAVMGLGLVFQRVWRRDIEVMTDLSMKLFVPCLAFSAIAGMEINAHDMATVAGGGALVQLGMLAIAFVVFRLFRIDRRGLYLPIVFMNSANLPFPILEANYGRVGLGYGVLYYLTTSSLLYTIGIAIVSRSPDPRTLLTTPVTIATVAALGLKATHLAVPRFLLAAIDMLGQAGIPLLLFIFGYSLGEMRLRDLRLAVLGSVMRLGIGFGLGLAAVRLLGVQGVAREIVIFVSTMPSAVVNVVIARQYKADPDLVASVVFLTSLAAIVILPLLLIALRT